LSPLSLEPIEVDFMYADIIDFYNNNNYLNYSMNKI